MRHSSKSTPLSPFWWKFLYVTRNILFSITLINTVHMLMYDEQYIIENPYFFWVVLVILIVIDLCDYYFKLSIAYEYEKGA